MNFARLKPILLLFLLFTPWTSLTAQTPGITIEDASFSGGDDIQIDVTVSNFISIVSFDFTVEWNDTILNYETVGNFNPDLEGYNATNFNVPGGQMNNLVTSWADVSGEAIATLDDDDVIFSLFFSSDCGQTGTTSVGFNTGNNTEIADSLGVLSIPILTIGTLTFLPPLSISNTNSTTSSCNNANDGCASVTPSDGRSPYAYLWSNGGTTAEICNLAQGAYTCTITDAAGCTIVSATINITEPTVLEICQNTLTDPNCLDSNDGCILLQTCGGTPAYTYNWSNGGTTAEICNLTAGNYTCTVTDANDCTTSMMFTLNNPTNSLVLENSSTSDATCIEGGSIDLTVGGDNTPFEFDWSNGDDTQNIDDLPTGTYACTITDNNGCSIVTPIFSIAQVGNDMVSSNTTTAVECFGGNDGAIDLTVNGTATPFTFSWSNNATTEDISSLTSGSYSCTVTDTNGCTLITSNIVVSQPSSAVTINSLNKVDVLCNGNSTGSISLDIGGGTSPYEYEWSTAATTSGISNLAAGTYSCTITDANDCTISTGNISISQPASSVSISNVNVTDVSCSGSSDGSISFSTNGGTNPYTYLWSNNETTPGITNLSPGQYQCTITDANGCTLESQSFDIGAPSAISIDNNNITDANCSGGGSVLLTLSGGSSPFTFVWSNGGNTNPLNNLTAGNYICTITDNNGCSVISPSYNVTLVDSDLALASTTIIDVDCFEGNNGSIELEINGTATPFQYSWNIPGNEANLTNLPAGTYAVTVTDATGCSISLDGLLVSQPQDQLLINTSNQEAVDCMGGSNGSASVSVGGGTSPYSYLWSTGGMTSEISNLTAGSYICTVTDNNGCTIESSAIIVTEPSTSVGFTNLTVTDLTCNNSNDGTVSLNGSGGTEPYIYLWNNGGMTSSIANLVPGPYQCTITDNNGCTFATNAFTVGNPAPINLNNFVITNASCLVGGSINLTVGGGSTPYTFNWSNGASGSMLSNASAGSYQCTVTDNVGCTLITQSFTIGLDDSDLSLNAFNATDVSCFGESDGAINLAISGSGTPFVFNWSNAATTQNINNLTPGNYVCTITDNNGCSVISNAINISQPSAALVVSSINSTNLSCANVNDGSISLSISGGTMPYAYNWVLGGNSPTISGLSTGTYNCTITDDNGCTVVTTPVSITGPTAISVTNATLVDASCGQAGSGSIDISLSGGITPYTYLWNTGVITQDLNNISSGTYTCTITDNTGCSLVSPSYVINNSGSDLTVSTNNVIPISCFGGNNGAISLNIGGTATPFMFQWSNGATTQNISDLPAGTYICTVTDANSCSSTSSSITVTEPSMALAIANIISTDISCNGNNDGSITLEASGGTTPYSYLWNNGASGSTLQDLSTGEYICTVTDANDCIISTSTINISEPEELLLGNVTILNVICGQGNIGSIGISISGGISPYTYLWSNGETTEDINGLSAGNYICTITDNNDCTLILDAITIDDEGSDLQIVTESITPVNCFGGNTGSISLQVSGSATPFTYQWNVGGNSPMLENLTAGIYVCTITDVNGCFINSSNITITQPLEALHLETAETGNSSCSGEASGTITIVIDGGTAPYDYDWSSGDNTAMISDLPVGDYTCTVTDANNCSFIVGPLGITAAAPISVALLNTANAACTSGGFIEIEMTGGISPYTYEWNSGTSEQNISNIPAGTYICTVTDSEGCTFVTDEINIFNDGTDLAWMATDRQTIICFGDNNGMIDISVSGTAMPFIYNWSNGAMTEDIDNLPPGLYSCIITDASGCSITLPNIAITEPESPLSELGGEQNNPLCSDSEDGNILLNITGGVNPYNYLWSNGDITNAPQNLGDGNYTATVTDDNGCTFVSSTTILTAPAAIELSSEVVENEINGDGSGSVSIAATGGTEPLSYLWSNEETTATINGLIMGDYSCTVTDENGCMEIFGPFAVDNIVATKELEEAVFSVFPNPTDGIINIESDLDIEDILLLDISGRYQSFQQLSTSGNQVRIEIATKGIYILEISFGNGVKAHRKVVVLE